MSDTIEVTSEQFEQIKALFREARTFREASKCEHLSLAQKLAYQRHANNCTERARKIGR